MNNRKVTLFTGQWADIPIERLAKEAMKFGFDGLELACWGGHFDPEAAAGVSLEAFMQESDMCVAALKAITNPNEVANAYCLNLWQKLDGLDCVAISAHLVGQAVCDQIDERHKSILPAKVWGDGDPEGVRRRAAAMMVITAIAAKRFRSLRPEALGATTAKVVVNGFTGSSIWPYLYSFPPVPEKWIDDGYTDFATRWLPILDAFRAIDVFFALEVHPTEIAFDTASTERALVAIRSHLNFGFNYDPSHLGYQGVDYVAFIRKFGGRIFHVHMKDVWWNHGACEAGVFGGHIAFGDARRYWDFRSLGHGDINFEQIIVALNDIGYKGPLSVEWEDSRMDRGHGAKEACAFVREVDFPRSERAFDASFDREEQAEK